MYFLYVSFVHTSHECVCVKKFELNNIKKNTKMPQCIQLTFYHVIFCYWKLLDEFFSFVTSKWRIVFVRCIFIGTIHLRDDEKYRKVLECFKRRVVHLSNTQQERYARRIQRSIVFLHFLLVFTYSAVPSNPWKFQRYHI